jgi:hypothetical protein
MRSLLHLAMRRAATVAPSSAAAAPCMCTSTANGALGGVAFVTLIAKVLEQER